MTQGLKIRSQRAAPGYTTTPLHTQDDGKKTQIATTWSHILDPGVNPHLQDTQRASHESDTPTSELSERGCKSLPRAWQGAAVAAAFVDAGKAVQQVVARHTDVREADGAIVDTIQPDL